MVGRSFRIIAMILLAAAGGVHCTSAQTETAVVRAESQSTAAPIDSVRLSVTTEAPATHPVSSRAGEPTAASSGAPSVSASAAPANGNVSRPLLRPRSASPIATAGTAVGPAALGPAANRDDERTRVRLEINRTERTITAARKKVERTFNRSAKQDFEGAVQRQLEAREALDESFYARASRLTLEARATARQVTVRLGPPQDDPDFVAVMLTRTDDALGRAKEIIATGEGSDEELRWEELRDAQKDARGLYKEGKTRASYEATRKIRDGVLTLLRDCDDLPVPPATAERALKRAARALELAKSELGDRVSVTAHRLEREAQAQMTKARVAFARKNYRDTLLHSKLVERKLESAVAAQRSPTNRSG
jgi:hypothetical protein